MIGCPSIICLLRVFPVTDLHGKRSPFRRKNQDHPMVHISCVLALVLSCKRYQQRLRLVWFVEQTKAQSQQWDVVWVIR